jgi:hypothetical protein
MQYKLLVAEVWLCHVIEIINKATAHNLGKR